jgi:tetratricopeptide (TPR) repeat protein
MPASNLACSYCGRPNLPHCLWCESCQEALSDNRRDEHDDRQERADHDRQQLYNKVLDDLNDLVKNRLAASETSEAIKAFYQAQLNEIQQRGAERAEKQSINNRLEEARKAAHTGNYEGAIELLSLGLQAHPGAMSLTAAMAEIKRRIDQERLNDAAEEAGQLLTEAKHCIDRDEFEEARQKLKHANQLNPDNREVSSALADVQQRMASLQAAQNSKLQSTASISESPDGLPTSAASCDSQAIALPATTETTPARIKKEVPRSFAEPDEVPNATQRLIDVASKWSSVLKPFLLDNVGWFVGAFLVIAGFVVLIVTFWGNIEQNRILMHSLVYVSLAVTTGLFFVAAYFMRLKYPQLDSSSNVLLVIVTLLIPLVFAAALLTTLVPVSPAVIAVQVLAG